MLPDSRDARAEPTGDLAAPGNRLIRSIPPFTVRGTGIAGDPAVISSSDGRVDVVALGVDGELRHFALTGGVCVERRPLRPPAGFTGHPSLTTWGPGRLDVFARDGAGRVQHAWFDDQWRGWTPVTPDARPAASDPAVASWGPGRFDVCVRTSGGTLDHYWYSEEIGFAGPEDYEGDFAGRPALASTSLYGMHLTARDARDGLLRYQCWLPTQRSHVWTSTPTLPARGVFDFSPPATAEGVALTCTADPVMLHCRGQGRIPNRLLVYALQDDRLLCLEPWGWPGTPHDRMVGVGVASDAAVASSRRCRADVFVRLESGAVGHLIEDLDDTGVGAASWSVLDGGGAAVAGRPAAVVSRPGRLDLFFRSVDDELCHGWWDGPSGEWNVR